MCPHNSIYICPHAEAACVSSCTSSILVFICPHNSMCPHAQAAH